ncbi:response regulator transcription factor [Actinocorallia longicatena]|uniref:response regulator transcription factor n=1 Tax=Actinocorallia longicatena TaxID=111803 RepID=UPI0031DB8EE4
MADTDDKTISIVLADDHTLLRGVLADALEAESGFVVVAQVGSGEAAVAAVAAQRPHLVLLDLEMPGQSALTTLQRIREESPATHVLILSAHDEQSQVRELLGEGVSGYLHKSVSRATLVATIRALGEPEPQVTVAVTRQSLAAPQQRPPAPLSDREQQVLGFVASALSNRQIASRLGIAEGTVKRHMQNIFEKLGAVSRIDAVNKALAVGLIDHDVT